MALEPRGPEAGLWRPPQELSLLVAGLGSTVLRSGALLTDFLGASARGPGRAFEAARGSPTSALPPRDRWEMAGKGAPRVGREESRDKAEGKRVIDTYRLVLLTAQEPHSSPGYVPLRVSTLRALLLGVSGVFPLPLGSSAGSRSPFCPRGPSLRVGRACSGQSPPPQPTPLPFPLRPPTFSSSSVKWAHGPFAALEWLLPICTHSSASVPTSQFICKMIQESDTDPCLGRSHLGGGRSYLVVPLARPGLEIEPGPGILTGVRSPLPASASLVAARRRPS